MFIPASRQAVQASYHYSQHVSFLVADHETLAISLSAANYETQVL
jgi:hypothetical protein